MFRNFNTKYCKGVTKLLRVSKYKKKNWHTILLDNKNETTTNFFVNVISPESGLCTIISKSWKQWVGRPDFINVANNDRRLG